MSSSNIFLISERCGQCVKDKYYKMYHPDLATQHQYSVPSLEFLCFLTHLPGVRELGEVLLEHSWTHVAPQLQLYTYLLALKALLLTLSWVQLWKAWLELHSTHQNALLRLHFHHDVQIQQANQELLSFPLRSTPSFILLTVLAVLLNE